MSTGASTIASDLRPPRYQVTVYQGGLLVAGFVAPDKFAVRRALGPFYGRASRAEVRRLRGHAVLATYVPHPGKHMWVRESQ